METARIAKLLAPFLPQERPETSFLNEGNEILYRSISTYIDILLRWNSRINLTAIRDPEEIVTRHFGESLFAARHLLSAPEAATRPAGQISAADVGSGAGFPGIPLKLWRPEISLTLIESNHKKATFLREVSRSLTLTDINILNERAEDLPLKRSFDIVTLRAVERFDQIFPVASNLAARSGSLGLLIGSGQVKSAENLGSEFEWDEFDVPQSRSRVLLLGLRRATIDVTSGQRTL